MSKPYILREFRYSEDYPQVRRLWETAGDGVHLGASDEPEEIVKKLARDPQLFLVAEADGRIAGSVLGGFDGRRGLVYHLAVAHAARRQGLGQALMDELERRLRLIGCRRCYLLVTLENVEAMGFYEKRGWERMPLHIYAKNLK
jgi:putative acetyltransferase